jgi:hypothetical protein
MAWLDRKKPDCRLTMMMRLRSTIFFSSFFFLDEPQLSTKLPRPEKKARGLFQFSLSFHNICSNVLALLAYQQEEKSTRKQYVYTFLRPPHTWLWFREREQQTAAIISGKPGRKPKGQNRPFPSSVWGGNHRFFFFSFSFFFPSGY